MDSFVIEYDTFFFSIIFDALITQQTEPILTFPQFEKYMREMEQRLQAQIDRQSDSIARIHERMSNAGFPKWSDGKEKRSDGPIVSPHVDQDLPVKDLGQRLDAIAATVGAAPAVKSGDNDDDRKRLKERLKEALNMEQRKALNRPGAEKKPWLEYIFGIRKADGRIGKDGSRWWPREFVTAMMALSFVDGSGFVSGTDNAFMLFQAHSSSIPIHAG
jgi:hypothetical protein